MHTVRNCRCVAPYMTLESGYSGEQCSVVRDRDIRLCMTSLKEMLIKRIGLVAGQAGLL